MTTAPSSSTKSQTATLTPPRVVLLMNAPTNNFLASYFINKGYSVEIIRDLKYCSIPLLKSARYIVLNPDPEDSPYYKKIRLTLQKMVPDKLFEQEGQELLTTISEKVQQDIQPVKSHPKDAELEAQKRADEDQEAEETLEEPEVVEDTPDLTRIENLKVKFADKLISDEMKTSLDQALSKAELLEIDFDITEGMRKTLASYGTISAILGQIDAERDIILQDELEEKASEALKNQSASLKKPMAAERLMKKYEDTLEKKELAKAEGKTFPPRKLPEGELYDNIIEMGELQDELLYLRAKMKSDLAIFFAGATKKDYLFKICKSIDIDSSQLHGGLYFFMGLQSYRNELFNQFSSCSKKLDKLINSKPAGSKKGGLGGFFKKKDEEPEEEEPMSDEEKQLRQETAQTGYAISQLDMDINTMEQFLVNAFWDVYDKTAQLIVKDHIKNNSFLRRIRAFMRFGLISDHPSMISKEQMDELLKRCDDDDSDFAHEAGVTNIVYPDEFLKQVVSDVVPPSFDEELELNGQGTPRYKYDKIIRKIYSSNFKIQIYTRELNRWQSKVDEQKKALDSAEQMLQEKEKGTKEYKQVQSSVREAKAEISRLNKIIEKINTTIETENESVAAQKENLASIDYTENVSELVSAEVKTIRKFSKLLANLKEPFFPFILRDNFKTDSETLFDKAVMSQNLKEFEKNDPTVYSTDITNSNNPRKQVMIRFSPTILILPCAGNQGFCISPSSTADTGRMLLPLMAIQQIPLMRMIIEMHADFRYDTAKENAGMDLMTSDTICAAYAKVRWDYRKKGKEFREKAGIYNDMQDKKNFKVHYRMYMESMDEAGKKLFFKCHEMYEGFVKYIPLPAGKEKHSKG